MYYISISTWSINTKQKLYRLKFQDSTWSSTAILLRMTSYFFSNIVLVMIRDSKDNLVCFCFLHGIMMFFPWNDPMVWISKHDCWSCSHCLITWLIRWSQSRLWRVCQVTTVWDHSTVSTQTTQNTNPIAA